MHLNTWQSHVSQEKRAITIWSDKYNCWMRQGKGGKIGRAQVHKQQWIESRLRLPTVTVTCHTYAPIRWYHWTISYEWHRIRCWLQSKRAVPSVYSSSVLTSFASSGDLLTYYIYIILFYSFLFLFFFMHFFIFFSRNLSFFLSFFHKPNSKIGPGAH